jgi:lysylphosphatidylglycerol synthetase-like protein (DUF2156 family)
MEYAPAISARPSIFVRIYFTLGVLGFSLLPLIVAFATRGKGRLDEIVSVEDAVAAIVALQCLLWFAQFRCGTTERPYWRSLLAIAACLSTRWLYLDIILLPVGLCAAIVATLFLALTPSAPVYLSRLVYWFYTHRMYQ